MGEGKQQEWQGWRSALCKGSKYGLQKAENRLASKILNTLFLLCPWCYLEKDDLKFLNLHHSFIFCLGWLVCSLGTGDKYASLLAKSLSFLLLKVNVIFIVWCLQSSFLSIFSTPQNSPQILPSSIIEQQCWSPSKYLINQWPILVVLTLLIQINGDLSCAVCWGTLGQ